MNVSLRYEKNPHGLFGNFDTGTQLDGSYEVSGMLFQMECLGGVATMPGVVVCSKSNG